MGVITVCESKNSFEITPLSLISLPKFPVSLCIFNCRRLAVSFRDLSYIFDALNHLGSNEVGEHVSNINHGV